MLDIPDLQSMQHTYKCKNAFQYIDDINELLEVATMLRDYAQLLERKYGIKSDTIDSLAKRIIAVKARL